MWPEFLRFLRRFCSRIEKCLMRELLLRNVTAVNQRVVKIEYKGFVFEEPLRFDVLVEDCLLLELNQYFKTVPRNLRHGSVAGAVKS